MKKVVYTYKALGDSIALLREVSGIPVKELCESCGISNRTKPLRSGQFQE